MHTVHIVLVEAESHDEAREKVEAELIECENPYPSWSDWKVIGGRWSNYFGTDKHILRYTENAQLAEGKIRDCLVDRKNEVLRLYEEVKTLDLAKHVASYNPEERTSFDEDGLKLYRLGKITDTLTGTWNPDSYIYDLEQHTTHTQYFRERLAIAPEMQYLVVVDFHF